MANSAGYKKGAPRNKTISIDETELSLLKERIVRLNDSVSIENVIDKTICGNTLEISNYLPDHFVDLAFIDPPYNLTKNFNSMSFKEMDLDSYAEWLDTWMRKLPRILKKSASLYMCGDWRSSSAIFDVARKYFHVRNRITWEREKGRGAKANWKNCTEDIWFCTVSDDYTFNLEDVKIKRKVIAPYKDSARKPKDWTDDKEGQYRITHPSNIWTDITIPFWSMPENTMHPTQKPEKLLAKIILASSNLNDIVFDPFLGSGTTSVVARKLSRRFVGIEIDEYYCCLAEKRLALAEEDKSIQGYSGGIFWERNTQKNLAYYDKRKNNFDIGRLIDT